MDDKTILWDCLKDQKFLASNYAQMATEAANSGLVQDALKICQDEVRINYDIFNLMSERGWYSVTPADQQEITKVINKASSMGSQK